MPKLFSKGTLDVHKWFGTTEARKYTYVVLNQQGKVYKKRFNNNFMSGSINEHIIENNVKLVLVITGKNQIH